MLVHEIKPELYELIKDENEVHAYSYIKRSQVSQQYIQRHFFKAEFTTWSTHEYMPYCLLVEDLGPILDKVNYKKVLLMYAGISEEMYPVQAMAEAKRINEVYDEFLLPQQLHVRKEFSKDLVFTIDKSTAQALDDAISFSQVRPGFYRLAIHISDVASLVREGSHLDSEAMKRAKTTYVQKTFTLPMFPRELNAGKCSLTQDQPRLSVTLNVEINDQGIVDFSRASYELTVIKSTVRLTYDKADDLITNQDESKRLLEGKCSKEVEFDLRQKLKQLYSVAKSRKEFRTQFESFASSSNDNNNNDEGSNGEISNVIVEELMLITSSMLPFFKEKLVHDSEKLLANLVKAEKTLTEESKEVLQVEDITDALEVIELIKKSSLVQ